MHLSYDPAVDAAYLTLSDPSRSAGSDTVPLAAPDGVDATLFSDWRDGRLTGIEILDASRHLFDDLLAQAGGRSKPSFDPGGAADLGPDLPDGVDPELWFWSERCGGRDYLQDTRWHTFPGRMAVYCPHDPDHTGYRISKSELPENLPAATRYWMAGFLAGNLPQRPFDDDPSTPTMQEWERAAQVFVSEGDWYVEADLDEPWRRKEAEMFEHACRLAEIGAAIEAQVGRTEVRVPADLAREAVETWASTEYTMGAERDQLVRERAAAFAYIGDEIQSHGRPDGEHVVVALEPRLVGEAITATLEDWDRPR